MMNDESNRVVVVTCDTSSDSELSLWYHTPRGAPTRLWGLTKGMLQKIYILVLQTIPCLVQQNVGW
jgi:hypothetical protein